MAWAYGPRVVALTDRGSSRSWTGGHRDPVKKLSGAAPWTTDATGSVLFFCASQPRRFIEPQAAQPKPAAQTKSVFRLHGTRQKTCLGVLELQKAHGHGPQPLPDGKFWAALVAASVAKKNRFSPPSPRAVEWDSNLSEHDDFLILLTLFDLGRFLAGITVLQREYVREM